MDNGQIGNGIKSNQSLRPAILIDKADASELALMLSHFFVGLSEKSIYPIVIYPGRIQHFAWEVVCPLVSFVKYPILRLPFFVRQNRRLLIDSLSKLKPTILHCFSSSRFNLARYTAERLDIPYILNMGANRKLFLGRFLKNAHCAGLVCNSGRTAEQLKGKYPGLSERISKVNIGTFVEDASCCFSAGHEVASIIIAQPLQNAELLVPLMHALKHLVIDGYEFVAAIIGTGPAEKRIHQLRRELGLTQVVTLVGRFVQIRSVFAGADIFIQTELSRGFNFSLMEAMSVGMAAAVTNQCEEDFVVHEKTALQFDPFDELNVYSTLQRLLDKRDYARELASNAQEYLRANYSVSRMVESYVDCYQKAQQWFKSSKSISRAVNGSK